MLGQTKTVRVSRGGFTLVELLVVIAIIAILAGMAGWALFAMVGSTQSRNTQGTIKTLKDVLNKHWQYVVDQADKDDVTSISPNTMALAGGDPARAKIIWRKIRLMEAFPQTYAEIQTPWVYSAGFIPAAYQRYNADYVAKLEPLVAANRVPLTESGACLLMALSARRTGQPLSKDFLNFAVKDTDGDGIPEFVDAWGNPLGFFRFAWNNGQMLAAKPTSAKAAYQDPLDPDGALVNHAWVASGLRTTFEGNIHPAISLQYPKPSANTPSTPLGMGIAVGPQVPPATQILSAQNPNGYQGVYVAPMIVSAGPDGVNVTRGSATYQQTLAVAFGLAIDVNGHFGPMVAGLCPDMSISMTTPKGANDNIYSFQLTGN